ncbi:MAG: hypothetical protein K2M12_10200 [Muribaculaceae bacterium]|nr:hypothetical protein [Muribaculaceae bacterium]
MKKTIILLLSLAAVCMHADARQPRSGYRGFLEWSNSLRWEKFGYFDNDIHRPVYYRTRTFYWGFTTAHGYQINPIFFVGAGLGMERCGNLDNWVAPIFLEGRADLKFGRYTPFADLRAGANMAEGIGMYLSPSVGYRFNWGRKMGVNLSLGLTLAGYKAEHYEGSYTDEGGFNIAYIETRHHVRPYLSMRIGIDF